MTRELVSVLNIINVFFLIYLLIYASYLFFSVVVGAWQLYHKEKMRQVKNEI